MTNISSSININIIIDNTSIALMPNWFILIDGQKLCILIYSQSQYPKLKTSMIFL